MNNLSIFFSTLFGIGYLSKFPGTLASFISLFLVWYIKINFSEEIIYIIYIFSFFLSLYFVNKAVNILRIKDPKIIVIDEYLGQFTVLLFCSEKLINYLMAFLLFRFFDIFKPFPINKIDQGEASICIILDDIVAGIYAGLTLLLINIFIKA